MTENGIEKAIKEVHTLEECLERGSEDDFPRISKEDDSYWKRYLDLRTEFAKFPVEMGALVSSIETWMKEAKEKIDEINKEKDPKKREAELTKIFENDPIIYLNKHGKSHIVDVQKRACDLLKRFRNCRMSFYELYILMCAIVIHDIGNIHGRTGHEDDIEKILSTEKYFHLIPDANERRTICRIAKTHSGLYEGSQDTISVLRETASLNNFVIRERLLAAILRFSDELADDYTRAEDDAINSGIINGASLIYHKYSEALHTVRIAKHKTDEDIDETEVYEVRLNYSFDSNLAQEKFDKMGNEVYLIDEIYNRTIKMERERRYCMRFMRMYIPLERIYVNVEINDKNNSLRTYPVKYVLEEKGYPPVIYKTMEDIGQELRRGCDLEVILKNEGYV